MFLRASWGHSLGRAGRRRDAMRQGRTRTNGSLSDDAATDKPKAGLLRAPVPARRGRPRWRAWRAARRPPSRRSEPARAEAGAGCRALDRRPVALVLGDRRAASPTSSPSASSTPHSLDDLEDILIQADLGLGAATRIREAIGRGRYDKGIDPDEVKALLADEVERALAPVARPLVDRSVEEAVRHPRRRRQRLGQDDDDRQARRASSPPKAKMIARRRRHVPRRRDRAARIWARRTGADFVAREQGGDAAGLAFDALTRAARARRRRRC